MTDHYATIKTFKESECSCNKCKKMCHTPCSGTPEDIEALIEAGFGDKLSLDWHCGFDLGKTIFKLTPALKGYEGSQAAEYPNSEKGCTFFHYGKCQLHSKGLKPTTGRLAIHNTPREPKHLDDVGGTLNASVTETWNTEKGKAIVAKWCEERGVPVEERRLTIAGALRLIKEGIRDGSFTPEKGMEMLRIATENLVTFLEEGK